MPELRRLRQEDPELEASLGYTVTPTSQPTLLVTYFLETRGYMVPVQEKTEGRSNRRVGSYQTL